MSNDDGITSRSPLRMIVLVISTLLIALHALPFFFLLMGFGKDLEDANPVEWVILFGLATTVGLGSVGLWQSFRQSPSFKPWTLYAPAALLPLLLVLILVSAGDGFTKDWFIIGTPMLLLAISCLSIPGLQPLQHQTMHGDGVVGLKERTLSGNQLLKTILAIHAVSAVGLVIYFGASFLDEPHALESSVYDQPDNWLRKRQLLAVAESSDLAKLKSAKLLASDELRDGPNYERALILLDEIFLEFEKKKFYKKKRHKRDIEDIEIESFARIYFSEITENPDAAKSLIIFADQAAKSKHGLKTSIKSIAKHREGKSILYGLLNSNNLSDFGRRVAEIHTVDLLLDEGFKNSNEKNRILIEISSNHGYEILREFFREFLGPYDFEASDGEYIWLDNEPNIEKAQWIADFLIEKQEDSEVAYLLGSRMKRDSQFHREALHYLRYSAYKGHPKACYELHVAYQLGTAMVLHEDNPEKSTYWFEKAALVGHPDAQREVGFFLIGGVAPTGDGGQSTPSFHERDIERGYEMLESAVATKFEEILSEASEKYNPGDEQEKYFSHFAKTDVWWSIAIALMSQYCLDRGLLDQLDNSLQRLQLLADWGSRDAASYLRTYQSEGYVKRNVFLGQSVAKAENRKESRRGFSPQTGWIREPEFLDGGGSLTVRNTTNRDAIIKLVRNDQRAGILFIRSGDFTVLSQISDGSYSLIYALGEDYDRKTEFFDGSGVDCRRLDRDLVFETSFSREQRNGEIFSVRSYTEQTLTLRSILGNTSSKPISPSQFRQF